VYLSNPNVRPEDIARLEKALGLDRPLHEQYVNWLTAFLKGDWGFSYMDGRPAFERILERVPATLELMGSAFGLALVLAIVFGSLAAIRRGKQADRVASALSFMGISMPVFWLGLILQLVFAVELRWFPSAGRLGPMGGDFLNRLHHLVLPVCTLAVLYASSWMRYVRASLIETLGSVFIRAGRARGASDPRILFRHALPNALIPLTTVWGMDLALLFSGAVVTETVFAWPGMGSLLVESVYRRDYSVLMGILMSGSVLIVLINLATDVVYGWLDPRVRLVEGDAKARRE
jgi:peptide/nickel transport system permease protein